MGSIMTKRDWAQVSQKLQLEEIPLDAMARILLECIEDLRKSREAFNYLVRDVTSAVTCLGDKVEQRQKMTDEGE
jgi:hypothetical protein